MTEAASRVPAYLGHILQAVQRIRQYTDSMTAEAFCNANMVQDAVIRNIEILGEPARNIERYHPEFAASHPEVPWEDIYLMRNRVAHGYFSIDLDIVWRTIQRDLPKLEQQVRELKKQFGD